MNSVNLIGRVTRDIELRYSGEMAIAKFTLAVDRYTKGEKSTDFIPVVAFGKTAETANNYLQKGTRCGVSGNIQTGSYEKDGRRIYTTDVLIERLDLIEPKKQEAPTEENTGFVPVETEVDIPF